MGRHKFKQLIRFLQERNVYHQFLYNYYHYKVGNNYLRWEQRRKTVFNDSIEYCISEYIQMAFIWKNTKEGHSFWQNIVNELAYETEGIR